jgi:hypothetical protein
VNAKAAEGREQKRDDQERKEIYVALYQARPLNEVKWGQGCFAQDAVADWWLCLSVEQPVEHRPAPEESVGIDLGLKDIAVTSDAEPMHSISSVAR